MIHTTPHPQAGQKVTLGFAHDPIRGLVVRGEEFQIEDWADRVFEQTWDRAANVGNWAAKHYSMRVNAAGLRDDNECVYGKIGAFGHIVHVSEFE